MWHTQILDGAEGTPLGELLNLTDRTVSWRIKRATAGTFTIPLRDPLADMFLDPVITNPLVALHERDPLLGDTPILRAVGPVQTAEEDSTAFDGDGGVAVTWTDAYGDIQRLVNAASETDAAGQIVLDLLDAQNAFGNTLLRGGTTVTTPTVTTPDDWNYKPFSEVVSELANTTDGFDFIIRPWLPEPDDPKGFYCGLLDIAPRISTDHSAATGDGAAIFEQGAGLANVASYNRKVDHNAIRNTLYSLPDGYPDSVAAGDGVLSASDATSQALHRIRQDLVQSDLVIPALRQALIDEHLALRKDLPQTITFTPLPYGYQRNGKTVRVPRFGVDYDFGDLITFRAVKHGRVRADGTFRVYGADLSLTKEGVGQMSPIVIPEDA